MRSPFNIDWDLREARGSRQASRAHRGPGERAMAAGGAIRDVLRRMFPPVVANRLGDDGGAQSRAVEDSHWVRVPICLLCTLDAIKLWGRRGARFYSAPQWLRTRCLNCERPFASTGTVSTRARAAPIASAR